jgi:hypothetical protein
MSVKLLSSVARTIARLIVFLGSFGLWPILAVFPDDVEIGRPQESIVKCTSRVISPPSAYFAWPDHAFEYYRLMQAGAYRPGENFLLTRDVVITERQALSDGTARFYARCCVDKYGQLLSALASGLPATNPWSTTTSLTTQAVGQLHRVSAGRILSILTVGLKSHAALDEIQVMPLRRLGDHLFLDIEIQRERKRVNNTFPYFSLVEVSGFTLPPGIYKVDVTWRVNVSNRQGGDDPKSPLILSTRVLVKTV